MERPEQSKYMVNGELGVRHVFASTYIRVFAKEILLCPVIFIMIITRGSSASCHLDTVCV